MSDTIDGLKQRLVGAFVILSLAIIFLPMIFDKPHSIGTTETVPVPEKPVFEPIVIKKPEKPVFKKIELDPSDSKIKPVEHIVQVDEEADKTPVKSGGADVEKATKGSDVKTVSSSVVKKSETDKKRSVVIPKPTVSELPVFDNVWMVQLGTFSDSKNAYRLRDRLRKDGFDGHTKKIKLKDKEAVRVFTGPFVSKQLAEKTKLKLDAKYKVKSIVLKLDA